jgi:hypothetical protein
MSAADQIDVVLLIEGRYNLLPEGERDTTIVFTPTLDVLVGVRPEQVTEKAGVWHVGGAHDALDLLERGELRRESTVHAQDLLVNDGCNWEAVEAISEGLPEFNIVAAFAFIVETIDAVDRGALVVASQKEEILWVLNFVGEEEANCLKRLLAAVDVITEEEIVCIGREAAVLKESQEIVVLAVNVTTDFNGCLKLKENGLIYEDVAGLDTETTHFLLS